MTNTTPATVLDHNQGAMLHNLKAMSEISLLTYDEGIEPVESTLRNAVTLARMARELETNAVHLARQEGVSWQAIADQLGITKQGAMKRYQQPRPSAPAPDVVALPGL